MVQDHVSFSGIRIRDCVFKVLMSVLVRVKA